jgi:hypothetical protein
VPESFGFCAEITGAVIEIFSEFLLPLEMYPKSEENARLDASEYSAGTATSAMTQG